MTPISGYRVSYGKGCPTLKHLEAVTLSLLLNFTTILVAFFGIIALREVPSRLQWGGIIVFTTGVLVYFLPASTSGGNGLGFALARFTVCANVAAALLGRAVNRETSIPPLVVTVVSMGVGAIVLLGVGLAAQGLPPLGPRAWATIGWLAVVNTALAFTLWNKTLRILSAVESSTINSTMLVQIAVLAWLFLGERLTLRAVAGLVSAMVGAFVVQVTRVQTGE